MDPDGADGDALGGLERAPEGDVVLERLRAPAARSAVRARGAAGGGGRLGLTRRSKTRWRRETTMVTIRRVELVSTNILQRGAGVADGR